MQIRTILLWIIIAGVLGAAVVLTKPARDGNPAATEAEAWRSLAIDPARVVRITRSISGQQDQTVERSGAGGEAWIVRWGSEESPMSWPADPMRVRAGTRNLSTQKISETETNTLSEPAGTVRVVDADGRDIEITFGSTAGGGLVPVRVDERDPTGIVQSRWFGRIQTQVRDAFLTTGFLPWRSNELFVGVPAQIRSVSLDAGSHHVELQRDPSGWIITSPFVSMAEPEKAEELVGTLLGLESLGFVDSSDEGIDAGFERPIAVVSMTSEGGETWMRIGSQADMGGQQVFARINTPAGEAIVRVLAENLAKLTPTPEAYIARIPSRTALSDISRLEILAVDGKPRLVATRSMGGWSIDGSPATLQYREAIDRLVQVLTVEPASGVQVLGADTEPSESMGGVRAFDAEGNLLMRFGFGLDSSDAGLRLLMTEDLDAGGQILWICTSDEARGTGAWLTAMASRRAP
ncbi:MAG: DUF4340 domain-containing protein [Phycisphaerales bacterium]|nr:DUF4340 domain-containing protein [Phycisphaerales bacterium]